MSAQTQANEEQPGSRDEGGCTSTETCSRAKYLAAGAVGALLGGAAVALATRAVPRMASQIAAGAMQGMAARMRESGCNPAEM